jgi:DNA-binding LacI/PurR family transcriptional regulator
MARSRPTLATVAEALGVSVMTVSNAYNRPEKLSPELRERVLATAAELGYAGPHAIARSLRRGRAGALGVVLGETLPYAFEDPGALEFLRGLARAGADRGVALHLVPAAGDAGDPRLILDAAVDAFVVYSLRDGHPLAAALGRRGLPAVIEGSPELPGCPLVSIDEAAAAAAVAQLALALGHHRLGVVSLPFEGRERGERPIGPDDVPAHRVTRGRLAGFRGAARGAALVAREAAANGRAQGEAAAGALLDAPDRPTALLCMSDELAIGALRAAAARGLAVPADVSVVGWDDTPEAANAQPPLTTVHQSLRDHGRVCAELAAQAVDGDAVAGTDAGAVAGRAAAGWAGVHLQPWELVVRASTGPPRRDA